MSQDCSPWYNSRHGKLIFTPLEAHKGSGLDTLLGLAVRMPVTPVTCPMRTRQMGLGIWTACP